ncbi:hypothetical protein [Pedobacter heparinus]|uniref:hypothetical protein n=1 Tax=Pedobacter heparinus TaxID=984 RepID=UPI00292D0BAF|nr:hypothetical protein [Pedobacter heparinus]
MSSSSVQSDDPVLFDTLDRCCQKIIEKMGDKPINEWRASDYNSLSSQLGKQTKVYLSENTLKRIFGRLKTPKRYFPQKATRDALAQFIGYRDWQEFELVYSSAKAENKKAISTEYNNQASSTKINERKSKKLYRLIVSLGTLVLLSFVAFILFWNRNQNPDGVQLVCENPFGEVPHTAVFQLTSNKFFDKNEAFQLDCMEEALPATITGNKKITRFFKNPGVVYVTLLHHNKPIDTVSVCLQTKGWVANSGNDTSRAYPIARLKALDPKNISVSAAQLDSAGLDTKKPFLIGFSNIHPSTISGDNFSFYTKVFAEQTRPGTQCIETTIIILGEKDRHLITLFRESCVALSRYTFSEVKVTGSDQFLGKLAFNPEFGGDINLKVENKVVSLILNGKKVFSTKYTRSIGNVMGVKILFSGIGKAISPEIQDLKTKEVF